MNKLETTFRHGIRTALSIRGCINNEIVYTESGENPLHIQIKKQQLNFWINLQKYLADRPQHYLNRLINVANDYEYIRYFKSLVDEYGDPSTCERSLTAEFKENVTLRIRNAHDEDEDSRLGAYYTVNPDLCKPQEDETPEFIRILKTRYRTGSHNLMIEKGRMT